MDEKDLAELHYLVGRLAGLRERVGQDIDTVIYYDNYRIRIDTVDLLGGLANDRKEVVP